MDLVSLLVGLPLAPVRGVMALAELLKQQAEQEMYDPAVARRELEEVSEKRAVGEISAGEEAEQQQEILGRLMGPGQQTPEPQTRPTSARADNGRD